MMANTFSMTDAVASAIRFVMETFGLKGVVSASAVVSVMMALYWGHKLSWLLAVSKSLSVLAVQHVLVSTIVVCAVVGAGLYYGVIPGIEVDRLLRLVEAGL